MQAASQERGGTGAASGWACRNAGLAMGENGYAFATGMNSQLGRPDPELDNWLAKRMSMKGSMERGSRQRSHSRPEDRQRSSSAGPNVQDWWDPTQQQETASRSPGLQNWLARRTAVKNEEQREQRVCRSASVPPSRKLPDRQVLDAAAPVFTPKAKTGLPEPGGIIEDCLGTKPRLPFIRPDEDRKDWAEILDEEESDLWWQLQQQEEERQRQAEEEMRNRLQENPVSMIVPIDKSASNLEASKPAIEIKQSRMQEALYKAPESMEEVEWKVRKETTRKEKKNVELKVKENAIEPECKLEKSDEPKAKSEAEYLSRKEADRELKAVDLDMERKAKLKAKEESDREAKRKRDEAMDEVARRARAFRQAKEEAERKAKEDKAREKTQDIGCCSHEDDGKKLKRMLKPNARLWKKLNPKFKKRCRGKHQTKSGAEPKKMNIANRRKRLHARYVKRLHARFMKRLKK